jgi:hypothetical protein
MPDVLDKSIPAPSLDTSAPSLTVDSRLKGSSEQNISVPPELPAHEAAGDAPADDAWREEVASRLDRYRARRKPQPPRYPSLRLRFEEPSLGTGSDMATSRPSEFETLSNHALALDGLAEVPSVPIKKPEPDHLPPSTTSVLPAHEASTAPSRMPAHATAKIIEFPRFTPPVPSPDELAEAVIDRPRILEVPDIEPPLPALGGITIEAAQQAETERRPGIDIPLQSAPRARRVVAAAIDGSIVITASAMSALIFWKVAAVRPPMIQLLGLAAGVPSVLWVFYQYLLLVYSASTPGLRLAGLELNHFDGTPTNRRLRRWRVLASYLSAISLGMGYAWVFLDEDALCWHDRITHSYLARKGTERAPSSDSVEPRA